MRLGARVVDILPHFDTKHAVSAKKKIPSEDELPMSMHPSLKMATRIATKRNVLKRYERIEILKKQGKWKDGDRAHGLPKTKSTH